MSGDALTQLLEQAPRLPFVVLVRWLEQLAPTGAAVGQAGPYCEEPVRFRHDPALMFHTTDVSSATHVGRSAGHPIVELQTTFSGLSGAASPLPALMLEELVADDDESALQRDFLDLFHHRLLGLLYRGLLKYDVARSTRGAHGRVTDWLLSLAGLAPSHSERLVQLSRAQLLRLVPLLVSYPPNAERLIQAVRITLDDAIGLGAVQVREMQGGQVEIAPAFRARLGQSAWLGRSSVLGGRAPAAASQVILSLSELSSASCARLSPGGDRYADLCAVATLFAPETVQVCIELTPSCAQRCRLGARGLGAPGLHAHGGRLGRDAWLGAGGAPEPVRFVAGFVPDSTPSAGARRVVDAS